MRVTLHLCLSHTLQFSPEFHLKRKITELLALLYSVHCSAFTQPVTAIKLSEQMEVRRLCTDSKIKWTSHLSYIC